jgi:glycosyltransferase involved in cell wall biosynthesis
MRIAFFSEVFLPKIDGVVNTLCRLLEHLSRLGHPTLLITTCYNDHPSSRQGNHPPPTSRKVPENVEIIRVPGIRFPLYPEVRLAPPWLGLHPALERFQPDLIHTVNPVALGIGGVWYARQRGIPLVASYQTDLPGYAVHYGFGFANRFIWAFLRSLHNQAHLNLAPSEYTRKELQANNFRRVKVWSRGVDTELFHPAKRDDSMRARLSGGVVDEPLLLFVGRLSSEKRIHWLRSVLLSHPQARLAIVGDGPQRLELENAFSGLNVQFTGFLQGDELAKAYASSDIFVFPSANETFGNVVLEAMASGLPVVVPNSGGVVDFVNHEKNGLIFYSESQDSLVEQTGRLISQVELRHRVAAQARSYAEVRNWSAILTQLVNDYERTIRLARRSNQARKIRKAFGSST